MKSILIAAAALAGVTAIPAIAMTTVTATTSRAEAGKAPLSHADPAQRYCVSDTPTGSRLPKKVCKTRADWVAEGVDMDEFDR